MTHPSRTLPSDLISRGQPCVLSALIQAFSLHGEPLLWMEQTLPLRNATRSVQRALILKYPSLKDDGEPIQAYSKMEFVFAPEKVTFLRGLGL